MKVAVPVRILRTSGRRGVHTLAPVFLPSIEVCRADLSSALQALHHRLWRELRDLAKLERSDDLAAALFSPPLRDERVAVALDLKRRSLRGTVNVLSFPALGGRVALVPSVPGLVFRVTGEAGFDGQVAEALSRHFRRLLARDEELPDRLGEEGRSWIAHVDVEVDLAPSANAGKRPGGRARARLGGGGAGEGESELRKVGRRLDDLGAEALGRALFREAEVEELLRCVRDRRPVLLVGASGAGKTAILQNAVARLLEVEIERDATRARATPSSPYGGTWLLSPGRLISGMSFVGEWEERLLAILRSAAKRGHVLYFDDLPGLLHAGRSASSNLTLAQVLGPHLSRGEVAVVAEITPSALRVVREIDRAFVDRFHLIPVAEPDDASTRRILLRLARSLEERHDCVVRHDAIRAAVEIGRRWVRHRAFPGKGADLLAPLALRSGGGEVGRDEVLAEFRRTSGLASPFLDDGSVLDRADVVAALARRVVGQRAAVEAVADAVSVARSHLKDPSRPFASLLLLGPTGIGKTQLARTLAALLFGSEERLVRVDMNELAGPDAAARLVGSPGQPEGLLTSAVSRQPFSVVLLDEIEKAHPSAFDVLLQILDDGRLTDALGRTADFTSAFVLLTSNLGTSEASSDLGFESRERDRSSVFRKAAEKFFRPELMGRLDQVVVFEPLRREEIGKIAALVLDEVLGREGLRRRHAVLEVSAEALARVADEGFHPQLGARALRRAIERDVVRPVAVQLAATPPGAVAVVALTAGAGRVETSVTELREASPRSRLLSCLEGRDPFEVLAALEGFLFRTRERAGVEGLHDVTESARALLQRLDVTREELEAHAPGTTGLVLEKLSGSARVGKMKKLGSWTRGIGIRTLLQELCNARDAVAHLRELASAASAPRAVSPGELEELVLEAARLEALSTAGGDAADSALLSLRRTGTWDVDLAAFYVGSWASALRLEARPIDVPPAKPGSGPAPWQAVLVEGPLALRLAGLEEGTHLFWRPDGSVVPVRVACRPPGASLPDDLPFGPVIRVVGLDEKGGIGLDPRTGLSFGFERRTPERPDAFARPEPERLELAPKGMADFARSVLSLLTAPAEIEGLAP